ncbi:MAG TPA: hypothetical protein VNE61_11625 [Ktedonobacteraceae bacterium]|nr:hypothetical protein [Ktedonobacteraceae bacterium]
MVWQLTAPQVFFIVIIAFGLLGIYRGWRREIISLVFILAGVLFLVLARDGLPQFVFVNLPRAVSTLLSGAAPSQPASTIPAGDPRSTLTLVLFFLAFVVVGYLVSLRAAPKATTSAEHILGVIPGVVGGYAILSFVTNALGKTPLFSLDVSTPNQNLISSYLLVIFIVAVVAIIAGLIAASGKKKGGAPTPKK